ncbi:MAG: rod-binding protein [Paracoccaceae bacterium]
MDIALPPIQLGLPANSAKTESEIRDVAVTLEASFLAEMLKHGGLGKTRDSFGGGAGEDVFSSLLVREQATLMAKNGGIGLAEHIVSALLRSTEND